MNHFRWVDDAVEVRLGDVAESKSRLLERQILVESMVGAGVEPDHATMMSAARSIAVDEETIDDAYYAVEARHTDGEPVSVESLNLVILACANLGCVP